MTDGVEWYDWGERPFRVARETGRPVLVWLTTAWCTDCQEMLDHTFGDPRIAANVNDGFVPVRVDADRRPRVRERYTMGGFPSTVFCTPTGEVVTGATYLGPDGFREILDRVRETYDARGGDAGSVPRPLRDRPPGGSVSPAVVRHFAGQLDAQWDDTNDGWGEAAKFPLPETVRFALRHDRRRAVATLDAIDRGLRAPNGGFYRYARAADWSDPARERTTIVNARLLRAFADAYLTTGNDTYRETAARTAQFLRDELWLDGAFAGSLAPDGTRDDTAYADCTADAVDALAAFAAYTDDDTARKAARSAFDTLRDAFVTDGRVVHSRRHENRSTATEQSATAEQSVTAEESATAGESATAEKSTACDGSMGDGSMGDGSMGDGSTNDGSTNDGSTNDGSMGDGSMGDGSTSDGVTGDDGEVSNVTDLLTDVSRVLRACVTAFELFGIGVDTARAVADRAIDVLGDEATTEPGRAEAASVGTESASAGTESTSGEQTTGAFRDGPTTGVGLLDRSLYPVDDAARLADALTDLTRITGDERYRARARSALAAFGDATDRMGVQVAGYARAVERVVTEPLVIDVGTPPGSDLHRAALRVADHTKLVVPHADSVPDAHATVRDSDHDPATDPETLARQVADHVE